MSGKKDQKDRDEPKTALNTWRSRLLRLSAGVTFLAIVALVAAIVVLSSRAGSGGDASHLVGKASIEDLLEGIPQNGAMLGRKSAAVRLYEYGDLQCPFCKHYSEEILPDVIESRVRKGEASITFYNFIIIGPQSIPAGEAVLAAGGQGKAWNFIETWYRNQGGENSGYANDEFIEAVAKNINIPDLGRWKREWKSRKFRNRVEETSRRAESLGLSGTPSFSIEGPGSTGREVLGTPETVSELEEAIEEAAGSVTS